MSSFKSSLSRILSYLTALGVILMLLHVVAHALSRQFFNAPIYGTNEIVTFWYLPVIALLGIPAAQLKGEHITVSILLERLGPAGRRILGTFTCLAGALLSIGFAWYGLLKAIEYTQQGATAGVTDIITWPVYYLVPIVFVLLALLYIDGMVSGASERGEKAEDAETRAAKAASNPFVAGAGEDNTAAAPGKRPTTGKETNR